VQEANDAMQEGITLVSRESAYIKNKPTSSEGDAWVIDFPGNVAIIENVQK